MGATKQPRKVPAFAKRFVPAVVDVVTNAGGKQPPGFHIEGEYWLMSKAGGLRLTVYPTWIAGRFDDPELAVKVLGWNSASRLNRYSGKWNFHFDLDQDPEACAKCFKMALEDVL